MRIQRDILPNGHPQNIDLQDINLLLSPNIKMDHKRFITKPNIKRRKTLSCDKSSTKSGLVYR